VDEPLIERWLSVPVHLAEIASLRGAVDPDAIRRETPQRMGRVRELAQRSFLEFLGHFGELEARNPHPHR